MLAMGRALMSKPKLLMLDEPSMGLAPLLVEQIFEIVLKLNQAGTTILLVEQNAQMALSIANRAYVLETGHVVDGRQRRRAHARRRRCARRIWAPDSCRIRLVGLDASKPTGLFLYPMEYSPVVFPPFGRAIEPCLTIGKLTPAEREVS